MQENITFIQQFLKKPSNSIISLGWGITPREVVDALGTQADGIVGEMPSGLPGPKAPGTPHPLHTGIARDARGMQASDAGFRIKARNARQAAVSDILAGMRARYRIRYPDGPARTGL